MGGSSLWLFFLVSIEALEHSLWAPMFEYRLLHNNSFEGPIPSDIGNLTGLDILYVIRYLGCFSTKVVHSGCNVDDNIFLSLYV